MVPFLSRFTRVFFSTGNNIYGEDIRATLESGAEQRSQFILMDLIRPPVFQNYIVRAEQRDPELADVISELRSAHQVNPRLCEVALIALNRYMPLKCQAGGNDDGKNRLT